MKQTASPECTAFASSGLDGCDVRSSVHELGKQRPGLGLAGWSGRCFSEACVVVYESLVAADFKNEQKQQKQNLWTVF